MRDTTRARTTWRRGARSEAADPIQAPRVPTITVQSETDVIGMQGFRARCDDDATARLWEIAGAAHFDSWGLVVSGQDDGTLPIEQLAALGPAAESPLGGSAEPINSAPSSTTCSRPRSPTSSVGPRAARPHPTLRS
jgi:hypothetical protein